MNESIRLNVKQLLWQNKLKAKESEVTSSHELGTWPPFEEATSEIMPLFSYLLLSGYNGHSKIRFLTLVIMLLH